MKHLLVSLAILTALSGAALLGAVGTSSVGGPAPIRFGMESASAGRQAAAGVAPDYGTFWVGPWTLSSGWGGPDGQMSAMRAAGVTPAIHLYYWGDDISPSCVENGCWSSLHNAWKDRAGWERLGQQLADHMNAQMGGKPVVVFLESEFNKGGIETYEPFDGYLATMASFLREKYPAVQIVLGFGNWGSVYWPNFDRAAAASDFTGIQSMRGSTRQSLQDYGTLYESLQTGATRLQALFGKPIFLTDVALSSYPEPEYLRHQADTLGEVFSHLADLKSVGVTALIYRSWVDSPDMSLANWYGEAERHWGLTWAANGTQKPAAAVWIAGVKAERGAPTATTTTTPTASPGSLQATFTPVPNVNEWWVEVHVSANADLARVDAQANGGAWQTLSKTEWGTWAKSFNVPKGSSVVFKATSTTGATNTSAPIVWMGAAEPAFTATFTPTPNVNEWWVEVTVSASSALARVEAQANGGSWQTLSKTDWGTWAKSFNVPKGSSVVFRATSTTGATNTSAPIVWMGTSTTTPTPTPTPTPVAFTATFTPTPNVNEWWVEVTVSANSALARVEAQANGGAWQTLAATDWGTWAKSFNVPKGSSVVFKATSTTGATNTSAPIVWMGTSTTTTTPTPTPTTTSTPTPTPTPTTTSTPTPTPTPVAFTATFTPTSVGNDWRVEVAVTSQSTIAKVEAREDGGRWIALHRTDAGTFAKKIHVEDGHRVEFRATSAEGATLTSAAYVWS